jgi:hypothetical protein
VSSWRRNQSRCINRERYSENGVQSQISLAATSVTDPDPVFSQGCSDAANSEGAPKRGNRPKTMKSIVWTDVEDMHLHDWNDAIRIVFTSKPSGPIKCPICYLGEFRYFYLRHPERLSGGAWYWCNACWRLQHARSKIPRWWTDVVGIPDHALTPAPDWLERHWQEILKAQHLNRSD